MRELVFVSPEKLEWRESADPTIREPRDAIVRPVAVAACDLDAAIVHGVVPFPGPFTLGHEFVADVVEAGEDAGVQPGDRVSVSFLVACGECDRCRRGLTSGCRTAPPGAMYGVGAVGGGFAGAFADLVHVPFANFLCVALPAGLDPARAASASDNVADGWRAVAPHLEGAWPGAPVLVVGGGSTGSIGLYAVDAAVALGAERVVYLDAHPERLRIAEALGASVVEGPPPDRAGSFPIVVDASGDPAGLSCALRSTAHGGVCTSTSIYFEDPPIPFLAMYARSVTLTTGRTNAPLDLARILDEMAAGRLRPERVITSTAAWDEAAEALLAHEAGKLVVVR